MFLVLDDVNIVSKILRGLLGGIDWLVYTIISWILEGIFNLSQLMASPVLVKIIYRRIYVILAIFMVFKLTVSFIQYLVSPDKMTDKESGVGKLIGRTVIMLAMLIILPIIFFEPMPGRSDDKTVLNVLQSGVMKTLPKLILGVSPDPNSSNNSVTMDASENGKYLAVKMLESFYYPAKCNSDSPAYEGQACTESDTELQNLNEFLSTINVKADKGGVFKYQYMWPLTTIAGILLVVILLGFAVDVSIRVFKLLLLQMIAPVPVMSYIDPKSSKDGAFASWLKTFTTTFLDIFLKLGVIYLLLLLISKLFASGDENIFGGAIDNIDGWMARNFVRVFLVVGLFKFAKDAPKFIKDALGIKDKGGGGGFMGKMASGLAGAAAGFAGGGLAGAVTGAKAGYAASGTGKAANAFSSARDAKAKALGRPEGGLVGRLNQAGLRRSVKKHTGLDAKTLKAAKNDYLTKQSAADALQMQYEADPTSVSIDTVQEAQTAAAKAKSKYEDANQIAKSVGIKKGFYDDKSNRRNGIIHRAVRRAGDSNASQTIVSKARGTVLGAALKTDIIRGDIGERMYGSRDNYNTIRDDRENLDNAKQSRDEIYEGGFLRGNDSKLIDRRNANADVENARQTLKNDKKDFRS